MDSPPPHHATKRPRIGNTSTDSDVTSEGADIVSDINDEDMNKLMEYEKQLKTNPNLYDAHLHYVTLLGSVGLREKLKAAREAFQDRFPLSEKLWMEWIGDETDPERQKELLALAVKDYLSIALWKQRLELTSIDISVSASEERMLEWRSVSEKALDVCGLHVSEGHSIWLQVIEVEKEILSHLDDSEAEDQVERIRQLYFGALQCQLLQLNEILESYSSWERSLGSMTTDPPPNIQSLMESAKVGVDARQSFEEALACEDSTERLAAFVAYCTMEERHGTLAQVECIYERALANFPVTHTLWLQYGMVIERKSKSFEKIENLYSRAVRNCPWLGQLWERLIRSAALYEQDADRIQKIYEQSLQAGLQSEEDYIVVILAWLDFLRHDYWKRHTEGTDQEASFEPLNNAFAFAHALMKSYFPNYLDRQHRIVRYWADCTVNIAHDIDQARAIWEALLDESPAAAERYETWTFYIQMEVGEKHHGPARKLYSRAFNAVTDTAAKYSIAVEWLRHEGRPDAGAHERGHETLLWCLGMTGTPRQYTNAVHHTHQFLRDFAASSLAQHDPQTAAASKKKSRKMAKLSETQVQELRRHKGKTERLTHEAQQDAAATGEDDKKPYYDDKNTLFVTRIAQGTEDDDLRAIFEGCGDITALRHLRHPSGETKGRAYVVFSDTEAMHEGLKKNGVELKGSKLLIQISRPTRLHPGLPSAPLRGRGRGRGRGRSQQQRLVTNDDFRQLLR